MARSLTYKLNITVVNPGSGNKYYIDGILQSYLTLFPGCTYEFNQDDSSNSGHPLRFYLDADKTTEYTTGVTNSTQLGSPISPGSAGAYTQIAVNEDTPSILYYQCSSHGYMGNHAIVLGSNVVNHNKELISFPTTTGTLVGTGDTGSVSNTMLAGSIDGAKIENFVFTDESSTQGAVTIGNPMEFLAGEGINTTSSGSTLTIAGELASTSNIGVASFNSGNFTVSSGDVTVTTIDGGSF